MFKDRYKKELDNMHLDNEFKENIINAMSEAAESKNKVKRNSFKVYHYKKYITIRAGIAIAFISILTLQHSFSIGFFNLNEATEDDYLNSQKSGNYASLINDNEHTAPQRQDDNNIMAKSRQSTDKAYKRAVLVDGILYYDTEKIITDLRCGVMDGQIISQVSNDQLPITNNCSNFGTGYAFQKVSDEHIDVLIDGEFIRFCSVENCKECQNMSNENNSSSFSD